jgi:hypothetical protein
MNVFPEPRNELQRWGINFEYYYDYYTDPTCMERSHLNKLQICKYLQDGALLIFKYINTPVGNEPLPIQLWARTFEYYHDYYSLPEVEHERRTLDELLYFLQEGARLVLEYYNELKPSSIPSPQDEVRPRQDSEPWPEEIRICES